MGGPATARFARAGRARLHQSLKAWEEWGSLELCRALLGRAGEGTRPHADLAGSMPLFSTAALSLFREATDSEAMAQKRTSAVNPTYCGHRIG